MKLTEAQHSQVSQWVQGGLKISEIQTRIASELGLKLTYMEVRLLVDDLKLIPKDPEPPQAPEPAQPPKTPLQSRPSETEEKLPQNPSSVLGSVSVSVDQIARPGALVSGKVKFSDGKTADWTLDQMGRLGLSPQQKGYRPTPIDVEQFQVALQNELAKLGF